MVRINILKFENRSSKNERIFLAPFNFLLLALVLRTSASGSFAASPSGCVNNKKLSRQNLPIYTNSASFFGLQNECFSFCALNPLLGHIKGLPFLLRSLHTNLLMFFNAVLSKIAPAVFASGQIIPRFGYKTRSDIAL